MSASDKVNVAIILLVLNVGLIAFFLSRNTNAVVTLDSKQIITELMLKDQSKIDQVGFIDEISQCLSEVIEDYAIQHKVMILPKQAAIAGDNDITHEIKIKIQQSCLKN